MVALPLLCVRVVARERGSGVRGGGAGVTLTHAPKRLRLLPRPNRSLQYPIPAQVTVDYGTPTAPYFETAPNSGVFQRDYTKASVQMDCNAYKGTIIMK